jgi:hypothetical protein
LSSYSAQSVVYSDDNRDAVLQAFIKTENFYPPYWRALCYLFGKAKTFKEENEHQNIQLEKPRNDCLLTDANIILTIENDKVRFFSPVGGFTLTADKTEREDFLKYLKRDRKICFKTVTGFIHIANFDYTKTAYPYWEGFYINKPESQQFNLSKVDGDEFTDLVIKDKANKAVVFNFAHLPAPGELIQTRKNWLVNLLKRQLGKDALSFDNQSAESK